MTRDSRGKQLNLVYSFPRCGVGIFSEGQTEDKFMKLTSSNSTKHHELTKIKTRPTSSCRAEQYESHPQAKQEEDVKEKQGRAAVPMQRKKQGVDMDGWPGSGSPTRIHIQPNLTRD